MDARGLAEASAHNRFPESSSQFCPSFARPPPRSNEKAVDSLVVWSVGQFRLFKSSLELDGKLLSPLVRFVKWDFAMFDRQQR